MDDNMSIDKKEDMRASSEDIMESTPEAEADIGPAHPENQGQPKRKGGRKPVCHHFRAFTVRECVIDDNDDRSMQLRRNVSNAIVRLRLLSGNVARNILSSLKNLFESMRPIYTVFRQRTGVPPMNASC